MFKKVFLILLVGLLFAPQVVTSMTISPTRAQLEASTMLSSAVLSKAIASIDFDQSEFSHAEIQYCFDNEIPITSTILYSPIFSAAAIATSVPAGWPDSTITEDEVTRQKTWAEYTTVIEVTGGFVLLYRGTYYDENGNHNTPTWPQLKAWVSRAGGFLTRAEVDAIRVVAE